MRTTGQKPNREGLIAVTFVVDEQGRLRVADRGSEHIACSQGRPVLSAGEMFFRVAAAAPEVAEVSNQSTGFCPEPESWPAVAAVLDRVGILRPGRFTQEVIFRRCPACGQRNIVKDGWFVCGVRGADLPAAWNFGRAALRMTQEADFLRAIVESPDDGSLGLVYADWLEERGERERAASIRVQCELARLPGYDLRRRELDARERELLEGHKDE